MKNVLIILLFLFFSQKAVVFSQCNFFVKSSNGDYVLTINDSLYELTTKNSNPNGHDSLCHHVSIFRELLSSGIVEYSFDTVFFVDTIIDIQFKLLILDDFRLKVLDSKKYVKVGDTLYTNVKYTLTSSKTKKQPIFMGTWKNGKKHGLWRYFISPDSIKQVIYRNGVVISEDYE